VTLDSVVVVVAAGNEHDRAQALRAAGLGNPFDTELVCPGQSRKALTVGAISKQIFQLASFSSRGPTSYGTSKPDLCAPGVNITSTVPVPRLPSGALLAHPPRASLFARDSGTSMATPFVAAAVALLVQKNVEAGGSWTPDLIKQQLLSGGLAALIGRADEIGSGRLFLGKM
jgi:subtilisin family serine protease